MNAPTFVPDLPGLDCGVCGVPTCDAFRERLVRTPELIKRCIHLDTEATRRVGLPVLADAPRRAESATRELRDSLGRDFDFVLQHFPEDPGPREIILPHNPMLTRELEISRGDVLIGRPLGMSCGCPVTHCGEVMEVDRKNGVITWCVTGPLRPRQEGFKDLGYYTAEAYEGLVQTTRTELKIGMRYFFQPDLCMLQWRHSGLVNYLNRTTDGWQVRLEGLWIG
jgi:uncharacterized Fe-S cluster-containing protein